MHPSMTSPSVTVLQSFTVTLVTLSIVLQFYEGI